MLIAYFNALYEHWWWILSVAPPFLISLLKSHAGFKRNRISMFLRKIPKSLQVNKPLGIVAVGLGLLFTSYLTWKDEHNAKLLYESESKRIMRDLEGIYQNGQKIIENGLNIGQNIKTPRIILPPNINIDFSKPLEIGRSQLMCEGGPLSGIIGINNQYENVSCTVVSKVPYLDR